MKFVVYVDQAEMFPKGYGRAWTDYQRARAVCMPLPFNWMAAFGRLCYERVLCGPRWKSLAKEEHRLASKEKYLDRELARAYDMQEDARHLCQDLHDGRDPIFDLRWYERDLLRTLRESMVASEQLLIARQKEAEGPKE